MGAPTQAQYDLWKRRQGGGPERDGITPAEVGIVARVENPTIGFTPEALTRRVSNALGKVHLTGLEGNAFGHSWNLSAEGDSFLLQSPPREEPWDSREHFIPDVRAQVSIPNEVSPDGQILWMDRSTMWSSRYDEISNGQKISMVLDKLLGPLEILETTQTPRSSQPSSGVSETVFPDGLVVVPFEAPLAEGESASADMYPVGAALAGSFASDDEPQP